MWYINIVLCQGTYSYCSAGARHVVNYFVKQLTIYICVALAMSVAATPVDRWQSLLFGCFLVIGCQKVQNRLFNGYEIVK